MNGAGFHPDDVVTVTWYDDARTYAAPGVVERATPRTVVVRVGGAERLFRLSGLGWRCQHGERVYHMRPMVTPT